MSRRRGKLEPRLPGVCTVCGATGRRGIKFKRGGYCCAPCVELCRSGAPLPYYTWDAARGRRLRSAIAEGES